MDDIAKVLEVYDDLPMRDGDVALLTDLPVVQEIEGLADEWDAELLGSPVRLHPLVALPAA